MGVGPSLGWRVAAARCLVVVLAAGLALMLNNLAGRPRQGFAHPGGLDGNGCHVCRTNCTESWGIPYGFYHRHVGGADVPCSGGGGSPSPAPPPPPRDTTPPAAPTHANLSFDSFNGIARVTVTAEAGSTLVAWSSAVGTVYEGRGTGAPQQIEFRVPEGSHQVTFTATDAAGNKSRSSAPLSIANPPLSAPRLQLMSKPGRLPVMISIIAIPNATVNLAGAPVPIAGVQMAASGAGQVSIPSLPDGQHNLVAQFMDGQGRTSPPGTLAVVVDTIPPKLVVSIDKKAAKRGQVKYAIETEPGAKVFVRGSGKLKRNYTAGSGAISRTVAVDDGRYRLTITAVDATGNESTEKLAVNVTS